MNFSSTTIVWKYPFVTIDTILFFHDPLVEFVLIIALDVDLSGQRNEDCSILQDLKE